MIRTVLIAPNRLLTLRAKPVDAGVHQPELDALVDDMLATLEHHGGLGLAAPQIGVGLRVIVVMLGPTKTNVLVNPRVSMSKGSAKLVEGCLSLPTRAVRVRRATQVTVDALGRDGVAINFVAEGQLAQVIQHEVDHLDGILMTARKS